MTKVAVLDHGAGNLVSIAQGLRRSGADVEVATGPDQLEGVSGMVLPGVGSTAAVMRGIDSAGFREALLSSRIPLLGICVGMQVLFDVSAEDGTKCLGLLPGMVRQLDQAPRLPHIGWNDLSLTQPDPLTDHLDTDPTMYFVHSFAPAPEDESMVVATSTYGMPFVAAVRAGPVAGVQFHPERSGSNGLGLLASFVRECEAAERAA